MDSLKYTVAAMLFIGLIMAVVAGGKRL